MPKFPMYIRLQKAQQTGQRCQIVPFMSEKDHTGAWPNIHSTAWSQLTAQTPGTKLNHQFKMAAPTSLIF